MPAKSKPQHHFVVAAQSRSDESPRVALAAGPYLTIDEANAAVEKAQKATKVRFPAMDGKNVAWSVASFPAKSKLYSVLGVL